MLEHCFEYSVDIKLIHKKNYCLIVDILELTIAL